MEHTHIVHAGDLAGYADTRQSQEVIPELVYHLVRQSVPDATTCRIPYGDAVIQPGMDGIVECEDGYFQFVPDGYSCWEIGTGGDPQEKANDDFRKRTRDLDEEQRANSTFVFVTPRSSGANGWDEPKQTAWLNRRKNRGWKAIRIVDGIKLADWLREFPALGHWMAMKIGMSPSLGGIITPFEHWDLILSQGEQSDPPLPPALFTSSRDAACDAIEALFEGRSQRLFLFAESEDDVVDFVAAYLAELDGEKANEFGNRCLFINDEDAWRSVTELRQAHVLVAGPRLGLDQHRQDLQAVATRNGHAVIIPLCGALSEGNPEIIKLRSPSGAQIENILKQADFTEVRARELSGIGDGRISALRRHFLGLGSVPPYVSWETAHQLKQASLIGQWDANKAEDLAAIERLLGKGYGEWIETLRSDVVRSDSPLLQTDEKWRFVSRGEVWNALGNLVTDEDLERFEDLTVSVLGEKDPRFELPEEERYAASVHGKELKYSTQIRKGLAESLALIGSRHKALNSCSLGKPKATANAVVRSLLAGADWERWAGLDSLLPLLAEASPGEFLKAIESDLVDLSTCSFHEIFAQEGSGGFGGWNYMSGLLWGLELLAWHPDYLTRVSIILSDIASIDPGGDWSNRPANSLSDIFLPWNFQTTASFEKRKAAVETVLKEQPKVGWELILSLLPHGHGFTSGCYRPVWRDFIPKDWKKVVLKSEYWEQIVAYTELAIELAKQEPEKLFEIVDRLTDLPGPARRSILDHLSSKTFIDLREDQRLPIWEKLDELVRRHRKYSDTDWALPREAIDEIENTAQLIAPSSPEFKYHHMFTERDFDLLDEDLDYKEQRKRIEKLRRSAVSEILAHSDIEGVFEFARKVASPYDVGHALAGSEFNSLLKNG